MQKIIIGILLFVIVLMFFSGLFFLYEARYMGSRASVVSNSFSPDNSYIISVPNKAKGDGSQKIRVTVFILNGQGLGVLGKKIEITNPDAANITIDSAQPITDVLGKSYVDIASKNPSEFYLEIKVDGTILPQKAHLLFE